MMVSGDGVKVGLVGWVGIVAWWPVGPVGAACRSRLYLRSKRHGVVVRSLCESVSALSLSGVQVQAGKAGWRMEERLEWVTPYG
jgi:hypothetical protein